MPSGTGKPAAGVFSSPYVRAIHMPGCRIEGSWRSLGRVKIAAHARTDVGRWRPANEDAHIVLDRARVFAVADGMGGHAAGEIASRIAVDVIAGLGQVPASDVAVLGEQLTSAIDRANNAIARAAEATPEH